MLCMDRPHLLAVPAEPDLADVKPVQEDLRMRMQHWLGTARMWKALGVLYSKGFGI